MRCVPAVSCEPCSISVEPLGDGRLVSITLESSAGGDSVVMERDVAMLIPYSFVHKCDVNVRSHLLYFVPADVSLPVDYDTELWVECVDMGDGSHEWLVHFRRAHARLLHCEMQSLATAIEDAVKGVE